MNEVATIQPPSLLAKMAARFSVEPGKMLSTLKSTAFKGDVSNEQMMALLIVADQYGLNPWTKEIYAFPDKNNGIVPVVGVDGWSRIINTHEQFDGMEFDQDDESCTCRMFRKDRGHHIAITEYMSECKRNVGPWQSHPKRMLRHKAMIQCARLAFGFGGIYDQDEAERIAEAEGSAPVRQARDPQSASSQNAPDLEEFEGKHLDSMRAAALNGEAALSAAFQALPKGPQKVAFWQKYQNELKEAAAKATVIDAEAA